MVYYPRIFSVRRPGYCFCRVFSGRGQYGRPTKTLWRRDYCVSNFYSYYDRQRDDDDRNVYRQRYNVGDGQHNR